MSIKKVDIPGVGPVTLQKHAKSRSLRLSVTTNGDVRVSMPRWSPYNAGISFAIANQEWIRKEQTLRNPDVLESGQRVGKQHNLRFEYVFTAQNNMSRVTSSEVIVKLLVKEDPSSKVVQQRARLASIRALKQEAEALLPSRVEALAKLHNFSYKDVSIKSLKRRWGSCNSEKSITFNLYLMELPWEYIDYVILHELTHTREMHHGTAFWEMLKSIHPEARSVSKKLRTYQPQIGSTNTELTVA